MKKVKINKAVVFYTLFTFFVFLLFLYVRFPDRVVGNYLRAIVEERYPGTSLSFASLSLGFPPGLNLNNCQIGFKNTPDATVRIEKFGVRPRLLSYLTGRSSLALYAVAYGGSLRGILNYPGMSFSGKPSTSVIIVTDLNLEKINGLWDRLGRQITGKLRGTYTLGNDGQLEFTVRNGTYQLLEPVFGFQKVDFTAIEGKGTVKGGVLKISKLTISGDKINYSIKGDITLNSNVKNSEINLSGSMVIPSLNNKKVSLLLTGTLGNVITRYM